MELEALFKKFVDTGVDLVWNTPSVFPWFVAMLLGAGIYVTIRLGFPNIRLFKHAVDTIRGKFDDPEDKGDINHFQALTTALSATVGIGNIAGVALGIHYGGPGIVFWLWVSGFFGMTLKFTEVTLAHKYRTFDADGNVSGGPMYTMERGLGGYWKILAAAFAVLAVFCSFGTGNMNQANTVAVSAASDFGMPGWIVGLILAGTAGLVIIGGIKRIGAVSSRLMPTMAVLYTIGALIILLGEPSKLPHLFATIFREAFTPSAAFGGTAVGAFSFTLLWGVKRALFSNEAGQGSAPIAHAAARTHEPVREGVVALLEPFVDTLVICTLTGLVIVTTGVWKEKFPQVRTLELNKIQVAAAPARPVTDRDLHGENPIELKPFEGSFQVREGRPEGLLFVVNDAFVDEPRLLLDGKPYTGRLTLKDGSLTDTKGTNLTFSLSGKMLLSSSALTAKAFHRGFEETLGLGLLGNLVVSLSVFLFGLSTIISWAYYGDRCVEYLFGVKYTRIYHTAYIVFTYLGAVLALETVWNYGDLAMGLMATTNLISVLLLTPVVVRLTKEYTSKVHKVYK